MLAIFIFRVNPNVNFIMFKSNTTGLDNPNSCPYDNHHRKSTFDASSPNNPPITNPDSINTIKIHIFSSLFDVKSLKLTAYS